MKNSSVFGVIARTFCCACVTWWFARRWRPDFQIRIQALLDCLFVSCVCLYAAEGCLALERVGRHDSIAILCARDLAIEQSFGICTCAVVIRAEVRFKASQNYTCGWFTLFWVNDRASNSLISAISIQLQLFYLNWCRSTSTSSCLSQEDKT